MEYKQLEKVNACITAQQDSARVHTEFRKERKREFLCIYLSKNINSNENKHRGSQAPLHQNGSLVLL